MGIRTVTIMIDAGDDANLDERGVAWKVWLDIPVESRVLVLGMEPGDVVGLARTWKFVEWVTTDKTDLHAFPEDVRGAVCLLDDVKQSRPPYGLIVVGRMAVSPLFLATLLEENGVLACVNFRGCRLGVKAIYRVGFRSIQTIAAVPPSQPRVFFQQDNTFLRLRGLSFHMPGRWWLRWALAGLRWLVQMGLPVFPGWRGLYLVRKGDGIKGFTPWIKQSTGCEAQGLVVYAGSNLPQRKLTLLACSQEGKQEWVIKLADSKVGKKALARETSALQTLSESPVARHVPRLIPVGVPWMGHTVTMQSMLAPACLGRMTRLSTSHGEFLIKLACLGVNFRPLWQTACWSRVVREYESRVQGDWPKPVQDAFSWLAQPLVLNQSVPCCRTHGDFSPWNIRFQGGILYVIDWEESEEDGLAFTDIFYYFYCQLGKNRRAEPAILFRDFRLAMDRSDYQERVASGPLTEIIRLWLLDRFFRWQEQLALHTLSLFPLDGGPPWKKN